jgi:hypothetical protein
MQVFDILQVKWSITNNMPTRVAQTNIAAVQFTKLYYSLRSIILFVNIDVSRYILVVDTSVLAKSNMGRREYKFDQAPKWNILQGTDTKVQQELQKHKDIRNWVYTTRYAPNSLLLRSTLPTLRISSRLLIEVQVVVDSSFLGGCRFFELLLLDVRYWTPTSIGSQSKKGDFKEEMSTRSTQQVQDTKTFLCTIIY